MDSNMSTAIDTLLTRSADICGGRIRIEGTRVTVLQIVTCYQQGMTPEEIADQYPHVNLAQIYADRDIRRRDKFRYDRLYIGKQTFWLDVRLIMLSFWITVRGKWEHRGQKF